MVALNKFRSAVVAKTSENMVEDIEGKWKKILAILKEKNIHVLPGGAIERYLPSFSSNSFCPDSDAKRNAVNCELDQLHELTKTNEQDVNDVLNRRYNELYQIIQRLPSMNPVSIESTLRNYLSDYVHELQKIVVNSPDWDYQKINQIMSENPLQKNGVVRLDSFQRESKCQFKATITVSNNLDVNHRSIQVSETTTIRNLGESLSGIT